MAKEDKGFNITGQMNVGTLKKRFKKEFGLTLRLYDGNKFADDGVSIASIRKKKGKAGSFEVRKSIKVENLEKRFEKTGKIEDVVDMLIEETMLGCG